MGADSLQAAISASDFVGVELSEQQQNSLLRFYELLRDEAVPAGGVGPHELPRLWNRHIADSLLFGIGLSQATDCIDIGTGVGLPGIPLAVAYPDIEFVLVDRSGRRCDLIRRTLTVLGLDNCVVAHRDVEEIDGSFSAVVSRAAIPPPEMMIHVKRLLARPGTAILGLSRAGSSPEPLPPDQGFEVSMVSIALEVLDSEAKLLRIEAT